MAAKFSLVAAALVALAEISHVLSQVVQDGKFWAPNQLSGPGTILHPGTADDGWRFFQDNATAIDRRADTWLVAYGLVDILLVAVYVSLVWSVARGAGHWTRVWGARLVVLGGCADLVENLLIPWGPAGAIPTFTSIKWVLLLAGAMLLTYSVRTKIRGALSHVLHALYTHRYTVIVVLPLGVLGLANGTDILEQIPDVQRAWLDGHLEEAAFAGAILTLVGLVMLYVGRQRTDHVWLRTCDDWTDRDHPHAEGDGCGATERQLKAPKPLLHPWFAGPVVLIVLALVSLALEGDLALFPLVVFTGAPVVIAVISLCLRKREFPKERPTRKAVSVQQYKVTAVVGDVLVGLLTVVAGLGSIRAFTGPVLLDPGRGNVLLLGAGLAGVLLAWPAHTWLLARLKKRTDQLLDELGTNPRGKVELGWVNRSLTALTPGVEVVAFDEAGKAVEQAGTWDTLTDQRWNWAVLSGGLAMLLVLASAPFWFSDRLGVIATFELALGCLCVVIAGTVILLQGGGAPEVFWLARIPYAPVTSLLVVVALVAGIRSDGVHDIRGYDQNASGGAVTVAERPTLAGLFGKWLADDDGCGLSRSGSSYQVRPLFLYAAEGGGIRAAYWTTKVVDRIAAPRRTAEGVDVADICRGAFLSSGASGGSVGLTIASVSPLGGATDAVRKISGPEALSAATAGMVLRDPFYAAAGIPLPSFGGPAKRAWADRGTLIEQSWEKNLPALEAPFVKPQDAWTWTAPGALVTNSTSTTTSCRTLISQIQVLSSPGVCTSGAEEPQPGAVSAADSTDLVSCTKQLRSTTAALLTARFPYVTPSGVVDCAGKQQLQIVDGGYAENFGIGTLVDLAPQLMDLVRTHNTCVIDKACNPPTSPTTLVAPMLVYLDNGTGTDLAAKPADLQLEVLVPPVTLLSAKKRLYSARSQLARAENLLATSQLWDLTGDEADAAATLVDHFRRNPVAIVFQATEPQIAGPLGWVLSKGSMHSMDEAIDKLDDVTEVGLNEPVRDDQLFDHTLRDVLLMLPGS